jgi:hypothetical protein
MGPFQGPSSLDTHRRTFVKLGWIARYGSYP